MTVLYSNSRYSVTLNSSSDGYQVNNLSTGVVEYDNRSLPRCIVIAREADEYLEFVAAQEEPKKPEGDGDARVVRFPRKNDSE